VTRLRAVNASSRQARLAAGRAKERAAKALAEAGRLELKFSVNVADCDPLVQSGDFSEDDLTPARASSAAAELWPDLVRHYAKRLEEQQREPSSLYRLTLPGSRTALGEARLADLEIARHHLKDQALELAGWDGWIQAIAPALAAGKPCRRFWTWSSFA
jgi:hypothetical protein